MKPKTTLALTAALLLGGCTLSGGELPTYVYGDLATVTPFEAAESSTEVPQPAATRMATETPTGVPTDAQPTVTLSPTLTETPEGRQVAEDGTYEVQDGDTLWEIAADFGLTLEELVAANPEVDPDLVRPGVVLEIPGAVTPEPTASATPTAPPAATSSVAAMPDITLEGMVATGGLRLRLRDAPVTEAEVVDLLVDNTLLLLVGRSRDGFWLEAEVDGQDVAGWVARPYIDVTGDVETLAVTYTHNGPGSDGVYAEPYAYVSNITARTREIYEQGQALGNRPNVFSKVGDSITVSDAFLTPIGEGDYQLGVYTYLQPVIDYYSGAVARDANSFANTSLAAKGGWSALTVLQPKHANEDLCLPEETPLHCEYRLVKPAVALIMLGTNDIMTTPLGSYEVWMRTIIETSIEMGVIPVISTIPDFTYRPGNGYEERVPVINGVIYRLADEYEIPLWDYHAATTDLPNHGLSEDGVHPSWSWTRAAVFEPQYLVYGMTVRNLTALQVLDAIWRTVMAGG